MFLDCEEENGGFVCGNAGFWEIVFQNGGCGKFHGFFLAHSLILSDFKLL